MKLTGDVKQRTNDTTKSWQNKDREGKRELQNKEKYHRFFHRGKPPFFSKTVRSASSLGETQGSKTALEIRGWTFRVAISCPVLTLQIV